MIRAVLDTNVLVSAAIKPKGHSDQIVAKAEAGQFAWLTSEFILTELARLGPKTHLDKI
jgi:predicted nucleic acid-binding protein